MKNLFILTLILIFLTIHTESLLLMLQRKGKYITKWLGRYAFTFHASLTMVLWIVTFVLIFILQFQPHPRFHDSLIIHYAGLVLIPAGVLLALWGFSLLGLKRALCLNFYQDNVPQVTRSIYKYIKNPLDIGLWTALVGFACWTGSIYNLIIAGVFILVMIPHIWLENTPLR